MHVSEVEEEVHLNLAGLDELFLPYSVYARAQVEGLQGDLDNQHLASCVKHFAAYGAVEGGREYNHVDISERRLRQEYLPVYKAAVDAGCKMVMTSSSWCSRR